MTILPRKSRKQQQPAFDLAAEIVRIARELQAGHIAAFGSLQQVHAALPAGTTIGMLHDCCRDLVKRGSIRLHPFTGSQYLLGQSGGEYALILGCEIMLYVEAL